LLFHLFQFWHDLGHQLHADGALVKGDQATELFFIMVNDFSMVCRISMASISSSASALLSSALAVAPSVRAQAMVAATAFISTPPEFRFHPRLSLGIRNAVFDLAHHRVTYPSWTTMKLVMGGSASLEAARERFDVLTLKR
jgi:hypothetical protein